MKRAGQRSLSRSRSVAGSPAETHGARSSHCRRSRPRRAARAVGSGGRPRSCAPPSTTPAPAPSGGTQLQPTMTVDGRAWYFSEVGSTAGPFTADIDFDRLQNQSPGASPIGQTRAGAAELIYNASKKTALTITARRASAISRSAWVPA